MSTRRIHQTLELNAKLLLSVSLSCCAISALLLPSSAQTARFDQSQIAPGGYVSLNSGIANMVQQHFTLPKDTTSYPVAGLTIFPYYEASPDLKKFLSVSSIGGQPLNAFPASPFNGPFSLPQTDLTHFSFTIPSMPADKKSAVKMAILDKRAKDEVPWMVAQEGGQAIGIPGDNDAIALVTAGTMFSACMPRTMVLRYGTMWVLTGSRTAAVLTKNGSVAIKPYSIAAIDATWFNRLRVAELSGPALELQLSYHGKSEKISIEKGQQKTIEETAVASAGSSDYVDNKLDKPTTESSVPPGLSLSSELLIPDKSPFIAGLKGLTPPFNNHKMDADFQKMLSDNGVSPEMRHDEINKQVLQRQYLTTRPALNRMACNARYVAAYGTLPATGPVPFPKVADELKSLKLRRQGEIRYLSSAQVETKENGQPVLKSGEALFFANQSMIVEANGYSIFLRPGAAVHMTARANGIVAVKNIRESEPGSVKIRIKGHVFNCALGGEFIAGNNAPEIFDEMKSDGVSRRNISSFETGGGTVVLNKSEVQLTTLMQFSPIMRKLYKSPSLDDKTLVQDIMKTIVSLNMVIQNRGGYQRLAGTATPQ